MEVQEDLAVEEVTVYLVEERVHILAEPKHKHHKTLDILGPREHFINMDNQEDLVIQRARLAVKVAEVVVPVDQHL